jgi:RNA polymerase sigma factor for flagellar operon FliA
MKMSNSASRLTTQTAERDQLILEYLPLAKAIALRVHENLPASTDLDDLVHAGILGLFDAATKYRPDTNVPFSAYAKHRIKGAMLDSLRQLDWASRDMRRRHKEVEAVVRKLSLAFQRTPTDEEVAEELGVDLDRWHRMKSELRNVGLVSGSSRPNDDESLPAPDFPTKPETHPDNMYARREMRSVLGTVIKTLPGRHQQVILLYYTNEMTMREIGDHLGINESRVSQIHKVALSKLQTSLQMAGIQSGQAFSALG